MRWRPRSNVSRRPKVNGDIDEGTHYYNTQTQLTWVYLEGRWTLTAESSEST